MSNLRRKFSSISICVRKLKMINRNPHNKTAITRIKIDLLLFEKSSFPNFLLMAKIPNIIPKKAPSEIPMTNPRLPKKNEKEMPKSILAIKETKSIKNAKRGCPWPKRKGGIASIPKVRGR